MKVSYLEVLPSCTTTTTPLVVGGALVLLGKRGWCSNGAPTSAICTTVYNKDRAKARKVRSELKGNFQRQQPQAN